MNILAFLLLFQLSFVPGPAPKSQPKTVSTGGKKIIFKSADGGQNWQDISEGLPGDKLQGSVAINDRGFYIRHGLYLYHNKPNSKAPFWEKENYPDEHSTLAPVKSGLFAYNFQHNQFMQKINGSGKWSPVYENFHVEKVRTVNVFETAGGAVFVICDRGLYKSTDNGKNWKQVRDGLVMKLVESNGVLMATIINGIIRSTDDGETWETVLSEGGVGFNVESIKGGFVAISVNNQSDTRRVRTSYDGGKTWQAFDAGLPSTEIYSIIQVGDYFFCGNTKGIYRSGDKGKTWQLILPSIEDKVFYLSVSGNVIYAIPGPTKGC